MLQAGAKDKRRRTEPKTYPLSETPLPAMAPRPEPSAADQQPKIAIGAPTVSQDVVMKAADAGQGHGIGREKSPQRREKK